VKLDLLFVSQHALWPADQGCKIHGSQMALAAAKLGARVGVVCMEPTRELSPAALSRLLLPWPEATEADRAAFHDGWRGAGSWLRHRLAKHQGLDPRAMAGVVSLVERHRPAAVIGVGLHAPLLLRGLSAHTETKTIWYAADELIYFNLSCMRRESVADGLRRLHTLALHAALENAFARGLDGAIGVSPLDTRMLRVLAGVRETVTIRNGVDLDAFAPSFEGADPHSLVFWGRLDFEPNIDAVSWFAQTVWPRLREKHPTATWSIVGKKPHPRVVALNKLAGVRVLGEVPDIRPLARAAAVTVLPMRCGGGIKNKLLEAAAMGRPIVASPKAVEGLDLHNLHPFRVCASPAQWVRSIEELWSKPLTAADQGRRARTWAKTCHSWSSAAQSLLDWVSRMNGGGAWSPPAVTTGRAA
jgi:glycosyltransferase involved in cell wall biosynthesis